MNVLLSTLILAVSLSIDALSTGIAYGIRKINVPLIPKLIICGFSTAYSYMAFAAGRSMIRLFPENVLKAIGVLILIMMGLWIILQATAQKTGGSSPDTSCKTEETLLSFAIKSLGITVQVIRNPAEGDIDKSGVIDIRESILLGLALSVDAIGASIGCAFTGFHSILVPPAIGLFQLIFLYAGTYLGNRFALIERLDKKTLSIIPGILLIFLAATRLR